MEKKNLKVLFIASECTPIAKVGGLGDVIGSLPKALRELRVDVRICLPKYKIIDFEKPSTRAKLGAGLVPHRNKVSGAGYKFNLIAKEIIVKNEKINIYQGLLPESEPRSRETSLRGRVPVYLLENEKYFGENGVYFEKSAFVSSFKEIQRFLFFSRAISEISPAINWFPDIIHCHDWHTAIVAPLLKYKAQSAKCKIKTLLTIHNLANQGRWKAEEIFDFLNLKGDEVESLKTRDRQGYFNIFQQGILNADLLNTVSPNYAKEILTNEYGEGLENFLLQRKKEFFGILNGIDEKRFNPGTDPDLKVNYSYQDLEGKIENKLELQKILNFKRDPKIPILSFIGRLTSQKGIDLIIEIIPELLKMGCQLAILGVGNTDYEKKLLEFSQKYPQNIASQIKFDPVLAQKIYAGADIFLMPSKFEPCGLGQMIAMRYGTIPVARKTGGLANTIEDGKTGFLFKEYKVGPLLGTIKKALNLYQDKKAWQKLVKKAMKKDFSWEKSAREYLKLYQILTLD